MKLKELQDAMIAAMKAKDKFRKDAISALVSAVKKKGIDNGCRDNIPDEMANEAILKEIKSVKEQIDTCPADRTELLEEYKKRYEIMSEFAPKMLSAEEVKAILEEKFADVLATKNKGQIMKAVMGELKVGAGVGLLVLFRVNPDKKENLKIVGILYVIGVLTGIVINWL